MKRVIPVFGLLFVVGLLFAQQGSYNQSTYSAFDVLNISTVLYNTQTSAWVGNRAVCISPATGQYTGGSLQQYCQCPNGCAVAGLADQYNYPGSQLRQSIDTYDPSSEWEQSWAEKYETCGLQASGQEYDWIREPFAQGCTG